MLGTLGLGAPGVEIAGVEPAGVEIDGGAFGVSPNPAGIGCLGPDKICPGRGAGGAGFAGIGVLLEIGADGAAGA